MRKNLLTILLGLTPFVGHADQVSVGEAEQVARQFFSQSGVRTKGAQAQSLPLKLVWTGSNHALRTAARAADSQATFYVFNRGDNQGFVIISGENATVPVLGYSHTGAFAVGEMPENLSGWMKGLDEQIREVRRQQLSPTAEVREAWKSQPYSETEEYVLTTPNWNQDGPYNDKCVFPGDARKMMTGCVMTATAEVMGYHRWPDCGEGVVPSYTFKMAGGKEITVPEVTLGEKYLWEKMPYLNGNGFYVDDEGNGSVATLMMHLGVMAQASYSPRETGASLVAVQNTLPHYMKYRDGIRYSMKANHSDGRWMEILRNELDEKRPVIYEGGSSGGAHCFVLDGYNANDFFHVNWGWGGRNNGFYLLSHLVPGSQGIGGSGGGFTSMQGALIGVAPLRPGDEVESLIDFQFIRYSNYPIGLKVDYQTKLPIQQGQTFYVHVGWVTNLGNVTFNGMKALLHIDRRGNVKEVLATEEQKNAIGGYVFGGIRNNEAYYVSVTPKEPIEAGDRIVLGCKAEQDKEWKFVWADPRQTQLDESLTPYGEILLADGNADLKQPVEVHTTASDNIANRALATFCAEVPTTPSDPGVEAFYAVSKDAHTVELKKIAPRDGKLVIPAYTGVVLATAAESKFTMEPAPQVPALVPAENLLQPTSAVSHVVDRSENAFVLSKKDKSIKFHQLSDTQREVAPNKAYLVMPSHVSAETLQFTFDGITTGIEHTEVSQQPDCTYDLYGRKVTAPLHRGVYVRNGKKVIIR